MEDNTVEYRDLSDGETLQEGDSFLTAEPGAEWADCHATIGTTVKAMRIAHPGIICRRPVVQEVVTKAKRVRKYRYLKLNEIMQAGDEVMRLCEKKGTALFTVHEGGHAGRQRSTLAGPAPVRRPIKQKGE